MGAASDLDPYVVRVHAGGSGISDEDAATAIAWALREAVRDAGLPELDANGEYASLVTAESLFESLGSPLDDETGALTRRMLLLLESRPVVNEAAYQDLILQTIRAYWKNEGQHPV